MGKVLNIKCPKCKEAFNYYSSESRPFCSERCKMIDMGHWLTESYSVPETKSPDAMADFDEFDIDESDQGLGNFYDEE